MSRFLVLMIGSWAATLIMIAVFALWESGKLEFIRRQIAVWFAGSRARAQFEVEGLELESGNFTSED